MNADEADYLLAGELAVGARVWVLHHKCYGTVVKSDYGITGGYRTAYEVELDNNEGHSGTSSKQSSLRSSRWFIRSKEGKGKNKRDSMYWEFREPK